MSSFMKILVFILAGLLGSNTIYAEKSFTEKASDSIKNIFKYDNPQECILDKMPDVKNDYAARTMAEYCIQNSNREFGEKRSDLFGPSNVTECFFKYASNTPSKIASQYIASACKTLYIWK